MSFNLISSAQSFLSYSHSKLTLHLTSSTSTPSTSSSSSIPKESQDLLLKAVLIQNAMDDVGGLIKRLEVEKREERKRVEEKRDLGLYMRTSSRKRRDGRDGMKNDWFEVIIEEDEEDEEDEEEAEEEENIPSSVSSPTSSTTNHGEEEWFEQAWSSLQSETSPISQSSDLSSEWDEEDEVDKVDVKIVDVLESDDEEELEGFSLFPPIPSSSFSRSSSSSSSSSSSRDEIYSGMPSSPVLQPTIIYDKMYVAPTTRTTPTSEHEVMETSNVQVIEDQELQKTERKSMVISEDVSPIVGAATRTMTGSTESFDSYVDSEPEFESDSDNEDDDDEDDDKDDPITPHQDILDSFDVDDTSSPAPPSIRNKTNTAVFMIRKNEQGREHGDGGCDNCSACLGVEQVGVDEAIF
jgi:hypothetical protein